jgi:beta-galactosidase
LQDNVQGKIKSGNTSFSWNNGADVLEPFPGTKVWATYDNQFYAQKAAVPTRKPGKGTVTLGPDTDDGALEKTIPAKVYKQGGIQVEDYLKA